MRELIRSLIVLILFVSLSLFGLSFSIEGSARDFIYEDLNVVPETQAALVLGARVFNDGRMSSILMDRAKTALDLYEIGKVDKLLLSGDHGTKEYDEVNTLKEFFLDSGVPAEDIFLDHAGFDTYDSIYRARDIFQVRSVTIVTQDFHLPRAVFIARYLGLDAYGATADRQEYLANWRNHIREVPARFKAFVNVVFKSKPKYLGEVIAITGDSRKSWD